MHPDHALEVFAGDIFHGDEVGALGLADVEHPADIPVPDLPGQLELVRETLDRLSVRGDFGLDELEGDLLLDLGVEDFIDPAHPAFAQLFDDLVAAGEGRAGGEFFDTEFEEFPSGRQGIPPMTDGIWVPHFAQKLLSEGLSV